jgi:hypothetical protein
MVMALTPKGIRKSAFAGAAIGAAVGGATATMVDAKSGPAFWAGVAAGVIIGPFVLVVLSLFMDAVLALRRRLRHH